MNFQIRPLNSEDSQKVLEIQANALRALSPSYSSNQIESLVRGQASVRFLEDETGIVATYQDRIVGFAALLDKTSKIAGVYVHPDFVRQGLGTRLLKAVEKIAIDKGIETLGVTASLDSVKFYKASGYRVIRRSGFYSEGRIWVTCKNLRKQLVSGSHLEKPSRVDSVCLYAFAWASRLDHAPSFAHFLVLFVLGFPLFQLAASLIDGLSRR